MPINQDRKSAQATSSPGSEGLSQTADTANDSQLSGTSLPSRHSVFRSLAVAGGLALGPHALCLLGLGGLGIGGLAVHSWCHDETAINDIPLKRLPAIPKNFSEFSPEKSKMAGDMLLELEPRFHQVIEAKRKEADGEPIKIVFLENDADKQVSVVFCKNGSLCPCSKPEIYEIGHKSNLAQPEVFVGQHSVLEALYWGK